MNHPHGDTHSKTIGYLLWIFGFTGAHRFYLGKLGTVLLWLFSGGLFGIGWLYDFCTLNRQVDECNRP
jgi:TM2 domain-containing membrane protein YozV